ncbi:MAG: rhomboid family intramembrane serine protease [Myxococcaceae bacterium]
MTAVVPLSDESRRPEIPPSVTILLIAINVVVFVAELLQGEAFVTRWSATAVDIAAGHRLYTLVTSAFLHGSWSHIIGNMVFFWAFGQEVEDAMGHIRYLVFYLLGAVVAMAAQVAVSPESTAPMLGASGAIAAVMGAFLVTYPQDRIKSVVLLGWWVQIAFIPAALLIGVWFLLQLVSIGVVDPQSTAGGGVAYMAHVGGMIFGAITARFFGGGQRAASP